MMCAAQISCPEMTFLMEKTPEYATYLSEDDAAQAERSYRRALGLMLKECGDRLLTTLESRGQILDSDHAQKIEALVDRIGLIFRRLDREGHVCLVGDCDATIMELEELDMKLMLMIEEAMTLGARPGHGYPGQQLVRERGRPPEPRPGFLQRDDRGAELPAGAGLGIRVHLRRHGMNDGEKGPLGNGRRWGALPTEGLRVHWTMEAGGPMVQGPNELNDFRGKRMLLYLEPGQYGLLVVDGKLRSVYLDGAHHLEIGNGEHQVPHEGSLTLLNSHEPLPFRFAGPTALKAGDGTGIITRGTLRLDKPTRFYHQVLRQAGRDWSSDSLLAVLTPIVRRAFAEILSGCDGAHAGTLQSELMALEPGRLDEYLEPEGLSCASLAAYTDTPPVEDCPDPDSLLSDEFLHN